MGEQPHRVRGGKSGGDKVELLFLYHQEHVARLERAAKEKRMLAGSLVTKQVSQIAALEVEKARLASLRLELSRAEGAWRASLPTREASTQTDDEAELLRREEAAEATRLRLERDRLQELTRGMPKNTANMVELLKKRNAALLAKKQRDLQRARADRAALEQRASQLQERLAALQAERSVPSSTKSASQ